MTIEKYGYARVSTRDQDLSIQEATLKAAGCRIIRMEKASGTSRNGRPELELLLEFMREGDELVITRIDRLARSISDLQDIVRELKAKAAGVYKGRKRKVPIEEVKALKEAGRSILEIAETFNVSRTAIYHALAR